MARTSASHHEIGEQPAQADDVGPLENNIHRLAEVAEPKPQWRGWIHAVTFPFAIAAGIVLVVLAPTTAGKVTSAIYAFTGILLFGISALYHRFSWTPMVKIVLKRLDHTNIMLVIAGTYTPVSWLLLSRQKAVVLLSIIWIAAIAGIGFRVFWVGAPRWLYVPIYVALGCVSVIFIPNFFAANALAATLILAGGVLYVAGAVVYGLKRPRLSAARFGFHELFHAFTVAGFVCHYIAIMFTVLAA